MYNIKIGGKNMESEKEYKLLSKLEEGTILLQDTCDAIEMDLAGNSLRINPHTEHWLVQEVTSKGFVLYNLDTQRVRRISKEDMASHLWESKQYDIKPIFRISKERA